MITSREESLKRGLNTKDRILDTISLENKELSS